jgi:hypothetical protein
MRLLLDKVRQVHEGVWVTNVPPHQLGMFGPAKATRGQRSVLLASTPTFDQSQGQLVLDADEVSVLNIGTTPTVVVLDTGVLADASKATAGEGEHGPGDREFLSLVERELHGDALVAAKDLFQLVRQLYPGDLKRGKLMNFSNTPDNFWYVIVQPQVQALSITVRGNPERFQPSTLELKPDRPGYTRFKLQAAKDTPEALRIIGKSKRRET